MADRRMKWTGVKTSKKTLMFSIRCNCLLVVSGCSTCSTLQFLPRLPARFSRPAGVALVTCPPCSSQPCSRCPHRQGNGTPFFSHGDTHGRHPPENMNERSVKCYNRSFHRVNILLGIYNQPAADRLRLQSFALARTTDSTIMADAATGSVFCLFHSP